jgi:hypothetical protein
MARLVLSLFTTSFEHCLEPAGRSASQILQKLYRQPISLLLKSLDQFLFGIALPIYAHAVQLRQ